MTLPTHPRIRPLIQPTPGVAPDGSAILIFEDHEVLTPIGLAMARPFADVVCALLDGTRNHDALQRDWALATGTALPEDKLVSIVSSLHDALLLEGEKADAARREALVLYRKQPHRHAICAGASYPADPDALRAYVTEIRAASGVAGLQGPVHAVLAPHIDPKGGGPCHGAAVEAYAACPAEVFVVLGTAHRGLRSPFALTTHDFETPTGAVRTDRALVERLAKCGGGNLLDDERAHAAEHSVEFQAAWLGVVHADRPELRIVPVLVGSQHACILDGSSPREDPAVADFVAALRELRAELGDALAVVASVDFAHVGPNYGDAAAPGADALERVMAADRRLLTYVADMDADGWLAALHEEKDAYNVCGAAPTWVLLETLAGADLETKLLRHDIWEIDPSNGSHVSFAAVAWRGADGGEEKRGEEKK